MNEALSPAEIVFGRDNPPRRNSELVEVADQIVTSDVVAVKVPARVLLVPTPTLPKFKEVTLEVSWPAAVPVPDKAIDTFDALETSVIPPIALPSALGIKKTTKVTLCSLLRLKGRLNPLNWKPTPDTRACEIVRVELPEFVNVSYDVW